MKEWLEFLAQSVGTSLPAIAVVATVIFLERELAQVERHCPPEESDLLKAIAPATRNT